MTEPLWDRLAFPEPKPEGWPETDPVPEVLTTDPWPPAVPVPGPVVALEALARAEGWEVRHGYSSGPQRAVRVGTYKQTETVGVWAAPHPSSGWRWCAMYTHTLERPWTWAEITIWRPGHLVGPGMGVRFTAAMLTDLKVFIGAHATTRPVWFKEIIAREDAKAAAARQAARNRAKPKKEGAS